MTDEDMFASVYRRYHDDVARYMLRRAGRDQVGDLVAEVFMVAWRRFAEVPSVDPLPWLYAVARRVVANELRSQQRSQRLQLRLAAHASDAEKDHSDSVVSRLSIQAAFLQLDAVDQETLRLIAWEQMTLRSAATVMGCSLPAFAARLHRARHRLRRHLRARELHSLNNAPVSALTREVR